MLGKLSSVGDVVAGLKEAGVSNWAVTVFVQGRKTRRWGVAWSWGGARPSVGIARGITGLPKQWVPFPSEVVFEVPGVGGEELGGRVDAVMSGLDLRWRWSGEVAVGSGFAKRDVWSRAARRGRARRKSVDRGGGDGGGGVGREEAMHEEDDEEGQEHEDPALGFKIQIRATESDTAEQLEVNVRWLHGYETVLWESFCGMLRRRVLTAAAE